MKSNNTHSAKTSKKRHNNWFRKPLITRLVVVLLIASVGVALLVRSFASDGQIYLSPASSSVIKGSNLTLSIRINPSTPVDIVENVVVNFDATRLKFLSIDNTGSAFESSLAESVTPGQVKLSRATFGASVSSDALIAKLNFQALSGNKNTTVRVNGNAASQSTGGYTNPAGGQAFVKFVRK